MAGRWQPDGSWLPGMPSGGGSSLSAGRAWSPVPRLFWPGQYRVAPATGRGLEAGDGAEAERLDYPQGADVEGGDGDPERSRGEQLPAEGHAVVIPERGHNSPRKAVVDCT